MNGASPCVSALIAETLDIMHGPHAHLALVAWCGTHSRHITGAADLAWALAVQAAGINTLHGCKPNIMRVLDSNAQGKHCV